MTVLTAYQREKLAYQYSIALEQGDMDRLARILSVAQGDAALENMLLEINAVLETELSPMEMPTLSNTNKEPEMPVFAKVKRKRGSRQLSITALVASVATILLGFLMIAVSNHQAFQSSVLVNSYNQSSLSLISDYFSVWEAGAFNRLSAILTPDHIYHEPDSLDLDGINPLKTHLEKFNNLFSQVDIMMINAKPFADEWVVDFQLEAHIDNQMLVEDASATFKFSDGKIAYTALSINLDDFAHRLQAIVEASQSADRIPQTKTSTSQGMELVNAFFAAWNNNAPLTMDSILSDSHTYIEADALTSFKNARLKERINKLNEVLVNVKFEILQSISDEKSVWVQFRLTSEFAPSIRRMGLPQTGTVIFEIKDGLINRTELSINLDRYINRFSNSEMLLATPTVEPTIPAPLPEIPTVEPIHFSN